MIFKGKRVFHSKIAAVIILLVNLIIMNMVTSIEAFQKPLSKKPSFYKKNFLKTNFDQTHKQSLNFSSYIGGGFDETILLNTTDREGNLYMVGTTNSTDFPVKNAFQPNQGGADDTFLMKINNKGEIVYSTYLGGRSTERPQYLLLDSSENLYIAGSTSSDNFPTKNAFQSTIKVDETIFITKVDGNGSIVYSTYLGGGREATSGRFNFLVDPEGNAYISGRTSSSNFPTFRAFQTNLGNSKKNNGIIDGFATKLDSNGQPIFSTYLGGAGTEEIVGTKYDTTGNTYVVGNAPGKKFPVKNAIQKKSGGNTDSFLVKFDAEGNVVFSTYLGGKLIDEVSNFVIDNKGNIVLFGDTTSSNFPTKLAFQNMIKGDVDLFITSFDPTGKINFSTFFGGLGNESGPIDANKLSMDEDGNIYILSTTNSKDFPTINAAQEQFGGFTDLVLAKLDSMGKVIYSTYLGGEAQELSSATTFLVNKKGSVYIFAFGSKGFPLKNPISMDTALTTVVAKLDATGQITYSSPIGRNLERFFSLLDKEGNAYLTGRVRDEFATTVNAFQTESMGGINAFIIKLSENEIVYSTFLGGSGDDSRNDLGFFAVDEEGSAYLTSSTNSKDFPLVNPTQDQPFGNQFDVDIYLTKLDATGKGIYSTYLGGSEQEGLPRLSITNSGHIYILGATVSKDFPIFNAFQPLNGGGKTDGFLTIIGNN